MYDQMRDWKLVKYLIFVPGLQVGFSRWLGVYVGLIVDYRYQIKYNQRGHKVPVNPQPITLQRSDTIQIIKHFLKQIKLNKCMHWMKRNVKKAAFKKTKQIKVNINLNPLPEYSICSLYTSNSTSCKVKK